MELSLATELIPSSISLITLTIPVLLSETHNYGLFTLSGTETYTGIGTTAIGDNSLSRVWRTQILVFKALLVCSNTVQFVVEHPGGTFKYEL